MLYSPRSFSSTNRALASIALLAFQVMNRFYNALLLRPSVSGMSPVCSVHHVVPGLYLENSPGALALGTWTGMASPEMRILSAGRVEPTPLSTALLPTSRKGREKWGTPLRYFFTPISRRTSAGPLSEGASGSIGPTYAADSGSDASAATSFLIQASLSLGVQILS